MLCDAFFQPHLSWLTGAATPGTERVVNFLIAGNRAQDPNHFVWYMDGNFVLQQGTRDQLVTDPTAPPYPVRQLFSDRLTGSQPFDIQNADLANVILSTPNGPLIFNQADGSILSKFSTIECRDNSLRDAELPTIFSDQGLDPPTIV